MKERKLIENVLRLIEWVEVLEVLDDGISFVVDGDGDDLEECEKFTTLIDEMFEKMGYEIGWNDCEGYYNEGMVYFSK